MTGARTQGGRLWKAKPVGVPYHWRARIQSGTAESPYPPWFSVTGHNTTETKLKVGNVTAPEFSAIGPPGELVYADSPPLIWSWHRGDSDRVSVTWSRNPEFDPPLQRSPEQEVNDESGIGN